MASFKSKIINFMLRNRHILKFKFKQEKIDFNTSIQGFREDCEKSAARMAKLPEGIDIKPITINNIKAEWIVPQGVDNSKVILYVHGGGYVSGSCNDHRAFVSKFAKRCGYKTLQYEYRLAPEHQYPAAVDDSVEVYNWLLNQGFTPDRILIAGESAGGGLCLALLLELKERNILLPTAAVSISPWTDLACTGESYKTKAKVCLSPEGSWTVFSKYYVGDNDPKIPTISPLYGDLTGLPPILIFVGDDEILRDDSVRFAEKAKEAGVDITIRVGEGMVHCYPLFDPMIPEAITAMDEISQFIKSKLK